ncbi:hypothetical protein K1T71_006815 [Dendrolimus kikuchii]|uniref:Uncharacterized protein n=1 Tax=Dendrolimus kikuchii TaxID=765133 RepID=A0ACC1D330_9NEOP|nr:hypothetical protein K1T71_006815 [Dendrolimus kikuchii]
MYVFIINCFILFYILNPAWSSNVDIPGHCDLAGFYLELGCTPAPKADNSSICPEAFTCPDLHPDPTMCYYRGIPYNHLSKIPQDRILNPCAQSCNCQVYYEPRIECAIIDCREVFFPITRQDCIKTYSLSSCCSGTVCGKDAIAKLKTCNVDGKSYKEGQTFEPKKNPRKTCVCSSHWDGNVDNEANCRDFSCGLEIYHQNEIMQHCAPVFYENRMSCPIGFECQDAATTVKRSNMRPTGPQCVFGSFTLNIGDEITSDRECTKCACIVPPFVSCTRFACMQPMVMMNSNSTVDTAIAAHCDMARFYLELGCTPALKADDSSSCPEAFTCPDLHPDRTKCYYRGIPYNDTSTIPQERILNPCARSCYCLVNNGEARVECAIVDCIEGPFRNWWQRQDCMKINNLHSCCSWTICGNDVIAMRKTCNVDGKTYKEGQEFIPKSNPMKTCVCTDAWDGNVDNEANCLDFSCALELYHQYEIMKYCAPIFYEHRLTCPIGFQCPNTAMEVIPGNLSAAGPQCIFGSLKLNVGDEVTTDEACTKCVCNIPPFISCTKYGKCN